MTIDDKHIFVSLLDICMPFLEKYLLETFIL